MPQPLEKLGTSIRSHFTNPATVAAGALAPDEWDQIAFATKREAYNAQSTVCNTAARGKLPGVRAAVRKQPDGTYIVYVIRESSNGAPSHGRSG